MLIVPIWLAFLAGFGMSVGAYNIAILQVYLKFTRLALLVVMYGLAKIVGIVILWLTGQLSVESLLILYAGLAIANLGVGFLIIPHEGIRGWNTPGQMAALSELFRFSKWVMLSFIATSLISRLDVFMLSHYRNAGDVGLYAAAFQLATVFPLIIGAVSTVLLPRLSRLTEPAQIRRFVQRTLSMSALIAAALLPILLFSRELIMLLFGQRYVSSIPTFQILFVAFLIAILANPVSLTLYTLDRAWLITVTNFVQLVLTFVLNLILVPTYGSTGAAITFLCSTLLGFAVTSTVIWRLV